ncbi:MAG: AAA family ATPase [Vicinamibacterales bacterium]
MHSLADAIAAVRGDGRQRDTRCPAHQDGRASLSVGLGDAGRVLLRCHTGCSYSAIVEAAGLDPADLSPARPDRPRVQQWPIRDAAGTVRAIHERTDRPEGKRIIWRQSDGTMGLAGCKTSALPLYGTHLIASWPTDAPIAVCEGERATDALLHQRIPAVGTVTGASGLPSDDVLCVLAGRRVVLWPDADTPGRAHMERLALRLVALGIEPRVIDWADGPDGGDAADYRGDVRALIAAARPYVGTRSPEAAPASLTLTSIGDLLAEPDERVDWLVEGMVPAGGIVVMAGKPKAGKSTCVRSMALAIARGSMFLGRSCEEGAVWYFAFEGRRRDVRAHFRQLGARTSDPLRVFVGQAPRDVIQALDTLATRERPTAIVIDTMQRFLRAESTDDYAEMTTLLDHVIGIAQRSGAAIILLHHAGKADRASIDQVLGSTAITGSADSIILLSRGDRYRTIQTVQRVGDDLPETVILLDETTGCVQLGGSRADAERDVMARQLVEALQAADRPLTREEWLEAVEGRRQTKLDAFRIVSSGNRNVSSEGAGTRNNPRRYRVTRSDSGSPVPLKEWEPESSSSLLRPFPRESLSYSGSQVPTQDETPEPVSNVVPWPTMFSEPGCYCSALGDDAPCGYCDGCDREVAVAH